MAKNFKPAARVTPNEKLEQRERKNQEKSRTLTKKANRELSEVFRMDYLNSFSI